MRASLLAWFRFSHDDTPGTSPTTLSEEAASPSLATGTGSRSLSSSYRAVNLKTAMALGLNIPASLLARADEVIE